MLKIEILGGGCNKCDLLAEQTKRASENIGVEIELEKVQDFGVIASYGVMVTPALVVDGEVKFSGKVLKASEIEQYLR